MYPCGMNGYNCLNPSVEPSGSGAAPTTDSESAATTLFIEVVFGFIATVSPDESLARPLKTAVSSGIDVPLAGIHHWMQGAVEEPVYIDWYVTFSAESSAGLTSKAIDEALRSTRFAHAAAAAIGQDDPVQVIYVKFPPPKSPPAPTPTPVTSNDGGNGYYSSESEDDDGGSDNDFGASNGGSYSESDGSSYGASDGSSYGSSYSASSEFEGGGEGAFGTDDSNASSWGDSNEALSGAYDEEGEQGYGHYDEGEGDDDDDDDNNDRRKPDKQDYWDSREKEPDEEPGGQPSPVDKGGAQSGQKEVAKGITSMATVMWEVFMPLVLICVCIACVRYYRLGGAKTYGKLQLSEAGQLRLSGFRRVSNGSAKKDRRLPFFNGIGRREKAYGEYDSEDHDIEELEEQENPLMNVRI